MPSSSLHGGSSPLRGTSLRRSRFTYRQLVQLASYQTSNPLRVIAHIDLDAFYAQCEMVRLGIPEDKPLAVQQWYGLIAINYAARAAGIGRHCNVEEARKLCPNLIAQHVATWREGDDKWAYRDDSAANIVTDKVSLDPYRLQSRRILATIKNALPQDLQKVEKASIDEVFLDLSAQIHAILLERFPELNNPPPYDDPTENLPLPSISALDWEADALVDLDEEEESADPDWDDVAILIGSQIVRDVRARIRQELGYTCSAGVASNKLISKLGSAFKKPNRQTVVRNRAVALFLRDFKITKMRNLGGKLGEQVVSTFGTDQVKELLDVPLEQMKNKLGAETGLWVYNTTRGIDTTEVNSRTQIKSMLSAKSFRPTISTMEQAEKWLRIFSADIFSRLVEEGVLENKRRPRTINLHHRVGGQMHSRQGPIPQGKTLDENSLFELSRDLLRQIIAAGNVWPCANLSLSVGGFEDGVKGNMGINAFLVKGEEAESLRSATPETRPNSAGPDRNTKRRRVGDGSIQRFFGRQTSTAGATTGETSPDTPSMYRDESGDQAVDAPRHVCAMQHAEARRCSSPDMLHCLSCKEDFASAEELQSHQDWHMARSLQDQEERVGSVFANRPAAARSSAPKVTGSASKRTRGGKLEQGQSRLNFG
ncbi:uncharacterized protein F5Z01DRAFT_724073 [Emericellopsis atlantica]|uniref:DNA polymerase eta n=1 Tax=Emericellopsis atlantica TaxID=2614577 RepID=A0A9P7ZMC6_9HYPO|nr:uncharacterized protein F5Z01DRAFT_724073 [Emericellopsis atlantica]KAG9254133.1 hypothetical protein F5Z01DRAFT_724073 [Emericellopsis atlantica]